jgi:chromosome segregation ATPase|tara:strand:+ start:290 stop:760 length:471 start_codon:yes stop_codon:yes gene_type:complete
MAEIEFAGLKVSGGKLLLAIPFLGSILAAMWGGFELYQRLLTAEQAVTEYVSPDFSTYDEALAVIDTKMGNVESLTTALERELDRLQADIDVVESIARSTDDTVAEATRELRDDVYALEERVNDSLRDINAELRTMRDDLEERIERILDNPLNTEE